MTAVAAFDFDGTICKGDAVVPFLAHLRGNARAAAALLSIAPLLRTRDRDIMKRALTRKMVRGLSVDQIDTAAVQFATRLVNNKVFPQLRERLQWHKDQGHKTIIVSASYDAYLKHVATQLGINELISTQIEIVNGIATGELVNGSNVRSHKKAELLQAFLGDTECDLFAYGNSSGDVPMMTMAKYAFMVDRSGNLQPWRSVQQERVR